jgi:hypothetical protein
MVEKFHYKGIISHSIRNNQEEAHIIFVFSTIPLNVSFHRGLVGYNLNCWHNLVAQVADTRLTDMNGKFIWGLH